MKAITLGDQPGIDMLRYGDRPDPPAPGPGEISVRLRATSLNFHDYGVVAGLTPLVPGRIPMSDGAGDVIAVGEGVTGFAVGDHVVSTFFTQWLDGERRAIGFADTPGEGIDGYACEMVTRAATAFTRAPAGFSHEEAATLPCAGLTAWRALVVDGHLKPGETVLVMGTGGVAVFALQIAKAMGARVIATSSSDAKLERLKAMGADHLINYKSDPEWGKSAFGITDGRGVDHVIDTGGAATLPQSFEAVRNSGHVAMIGVLAGFEGPVPTVRLISRQIRLLGISVGSRTHQQEFVRALECLNIQPVIDARTFSLCELADAFHYEKSGAHFGKIAVTI